MKGIGDVQSVRVPHKRLLDSVRIRKDNIR